ncbi:MAG: bacillithiol biosynthesis deacetylase BshB1 [Chitinophagaceae bacterium]|jgi:N-acetylglucosamine malate deacetylase 1|nr:bacillithiol biosynthesis deacetylase BshB1 [Chitinophagaceae bacterium]NDE78474.1 bacillithiol biosynthesis deacetylase BshB1 [Chitinophagaceae bacterium]
MQVDLLAIGVHPDDVELSCSGTLINEIKAGKKVAIVDLTEGELGTRGNIQTRYQEAAEAAIIMGVHARENLKMRDGFFKNDESHQLQLIKAIRKYRPSIVLANALHDRHPDHGRASQLIAESCFLSGLQKIETKDENGVSQKKWRPAYVFHYIQDRFQEPHFIVDISSVFDQKMQAIRAYATQFHNPADQADEPQTYISSKNFLDSIIARARLLGKRIGVEYGEGFLSAKNIGIKSLDALIQNET